MNAIPSTADVLRAMNDRLECWPDSYNDLYAATWQVSHVRFVEISLSQSANDANLLVWVLLRGRAPQRDVADWLPNSFVLPARTQDLKNDIAYAISDLREGIEARGGDAILMLMDVLQRLNVDEAEYVGTLSSCEDRLESVAAYQCGPTCQTFWRVRDRFYFLEIHNES